MKGTKKKRENGPRTQTGNLSVYSISVTSCGYSLMWCHNMVVINTFFLPFVEQTMQLKSVGRCQKYDTNNEALMIYIFN